MNLEGGFQQCLRSKAWIICSFVIMLVFRDSEPVVLYQIESTRNEITKLKLKSCSFKFDRKKGRGGIDIAYGDLVQSL